MFLAAVYWTIFRFPRVQVLNNMTDVHFYLFNRNVFSILVPFYEHQRSKQKNKSLETFSSLKDEFIPWLVKAQFCFSTVAALLAKLQGPFTDMSESFLADIETDVFREYRQDKSINDLSCVAYKIAPHDAIVVENTGGIPFVSICQRANSLSQFMELNRLIARNASGNQGQQVPASCLIAPKCQIGADCLVGESCVIGDKCTIKKSVIGSHCQLGNMVKLSNCVIFDHVKLDANVNLTNCIIGSRVIIHEKTIMKDCEVAHHVTIPADSSLKGEVIVNHGSDSEDSIDF